MGWAEYKSYNDKLTEISIIYNELIYLCNNFDIKRINLLLINIIENYDFYIKGDQAVMTTGIPVINEIAPAPEHSERLMIHSKFPLYNNRGKPIGVVGFPGSGISANLLDKARKQGIPVRAYDSKET